MSYQNHKMGWLLWGLILVTLFIPVYVLAGIEWSNQYPMDLRNESGI